MSSKRLAYEFPCSGRFPKGSMCVYEVFRSCEGWFYQLDTVAPPVGPFKSARRAQSAAESEIDSKYAANVF